MNRLLKLKKLQLLLIDWLWRKLHLPIESMAVNIGGDSVYSFVGVRLGLTHQYTLLGLLVFEFTSIHSIKSLPSEKFTSTFGTPCNAIRVTSYIIKPYNLTYESDSPDFIESPWGIRNTLVSHLCKVDAPEAAINEVDWWFTTPVSQAILRQVKSKENLHEFDYDE